MHEPCKAKAKICTALISREITVSERFRNTGMNKWYNSCLFINDCYYYFNIEECELSPSFCSSNVCHWYIDNSDTFKVMDLNSKEESVVICFPRESLGLLKPSVKQLLNMHKHPYEMFIKGISQHDHEPLSKNQAILFSLR